MALHRLTSITMGVPNVEETAAYYREFGLSIGFKMVFSGPLVRSSYMADHVSEQAHR